VTGVKGDFMRGDLVEIATPDDSRVARGLACYPADDILRICGLKSEEIKRVLGYTFGDEVVHRDDMVVKR
jgi:glutamate 5-kinase